MGGFERLEGPTDRREDVITVRYHVLQPPPLYRSPLRHRVRPAAVPHVWSRLLCQPSPRSVCMIMHDRFVPEPHGSAADRAIPRASECQGAPAVRSLGRYRFCLRRLHIDGSTGTAGLSRNVTRAPARGRAVPPFCTLAHARTRRAEYVPGRRGQDVHAPIMWPRRGRRPGCSAHHAPTCRAGFLRCRGLAPAAKWPVTRSGWAAPGSAQAEPRRAGAI